MEDPDSERDETALSEDQVRQIEAAKAELANIYRLRGEIVSQVRNCSVSGLLGASDSGLLEAMPKYTATMVSA